MTELDPLTIDQQRRVVLAKAARGVLASSTLVSSSGPPVDDVIALATWLEGPPWFPTYRDDFADGVKEEGPRDGWGDEAHVTGFEARYGGEDQIRADHEDDIRYTEDCEDTPTTGLLSLTKPYGELNEFERVGLGRLREAIEELDAQNYPEHDDPADGRGSE